MFLWSKETTPFFNAVCLDACAHKDCNNIYKPTSIVVHVFGLFFLAVVLCQCSFIFIAYLLATA